MTYNKKWNKEYQKKNRERRKQWELEYRKKNLERLREIDRKRHWENRDRKLSYLKEWGLKNKERKSKMAKEYREKNIEEIREKKSKYLKSHHGRLLNALAKIRYRTKIMKLITDYTKKEWNDKLNETKGICPWCKQKVGIKKLTLDHIIPVSKAPISFVYTIDKVQPLCKPCNSSKNNKIIK